MRDLSTDELGFIYGAGGRGCSPRPPRCGGGRGSKSKKSGSKKSKCKKSKSKHSRSRRYC